MDIDWDAAIEERDLWGECKTSYDSDFIKFLERMADQCKLDESRKSARLVIDTYALFETLSDEDKVTVTLMGW